uniref:Uncharacterized protein n=1 Tax=Rhizophora mucronata TaxID=61149 RepID=A0A2P2IUF6_RHIMU
MIAYKVAYASCDIFFVGFVEPILIKVVSTCDTGLSPKHTLRHALSNTA